MSNSTASTRRNYSRQQPCTSCPYRKDARLQLWSIEEFKKLLRYEKAYLGSV